MKILLKKTDTNLYQYQGNKPINLGSNKVNPYDFFYTNESKHTGYEFDLYLDTIKLSGFKFDKAGNVYYGDYLNNALTVEYVNGDIILENRPYEKNRIQNILDSYRNRNMLFAHLYIIVVTCFESIRGFYYAG